MIVWTISDVIGIALLILIILVGLSLWIVIAIKDKLHSIFKRNKANKNSDNNTGE